MLNNQYRKHYYLDEITIIAPKRRKRPVNTDDVHSEKNQSICQFCDNKEAITYAWPNKTNWQIKSVKNIYPCVDFDYKEAKGYQEVIIEYPNHNKHINQISATELFNIFKAYQNRMQYSLNLKDIKYVSIFKNIGKQAGASQEHLHSQVWAVPFIPPQINIEIKAIKNYITKNNICPVCAALDFEQKQKQRILRSDKSVLLNPYSSRFTYEAWIIPKKHYASLLDIDDETLKIMANLAYEYCCFIESKGYDYSLIMHDLQFKNGHFYIKILPRTFPMQIMSGVELEAGLNVNVIAPESIKKEFFDYILQI